MIKSLAKSNIFKYMVTGGFAFLMDYGVLALFLYLFGLGTGISTAAGLSAGILVGFGLNKTWTFKASKQSAKTRKQFALYLILVGFNYVISVLLMVWLDEYVPVLILKPFVAGLIAVWNYFICKNYIFKKQPI